MPGAEGVRLFRFDRIVDARGARRAVGAARARRRRRRPDTSLFDADPALPSATLRVAPAAAWMFDYYPMRVLRELPDGYCEAAMTYASDEWMARLVLGFGVGGHRAGAAGRWRIGCATAAAACGATGAY